jgi:hypothetical protein
VAHDLAVFGFFGCAWEAQMKSWPVGGMRTAIPKSGAGADLANRLRSRHGLTKTTVSTPITEETVREMKVRARSTYLCGVRAGYCEVEGVCERQACLLRSSIPEC